MYRADIGHFAAPWIALAAVAGVGIGRPCAEAQVEDPYTKARHRMVREAIVPQGVTNPRVIRSMRNTPRHEFVAPEHRSKAYFDMSLPIGARQTITPPFVVAIMTQALDPQPTDKVLEVGTGCGYQAAVLSPLVDSVYTIEIVEELGRKATETLKRLGYKNVHVRIGDGFQGWPEQAPFDKIIVTCSPEKVPQPLVEQLKEGGLLVIPVGERYRQTLYLMRKRDGKLESESLRPTLFVPMTGRAESEREKQPDPARPTIANGDFEEPLDDAGYIRGWFYQRQVHRETGSKAPRGEHYVCFRNRTPGRPSHMLQGMPVDGRKVTKLILSASVATRGVKAKPRTRSWPALALTLYDENRAEVATIVMGPFLGTHSWKRAAKTIRVPVSAREAIVRVGLFGATGEFCVDDVQIEASE